MTALDLAILRDRYVSFFGVEGVRNGAIDAIRSSLKVELPRALVAISEFYSGGLLGGISHHSLDTCGPATNVTDETLRLRSAIDLPHRYLALAEPPESLIVLDCQSGAVIWCGVQDVYRLEDLEEMLGPMDVWSDYLDFFAFLLNEEQADRETQ